MFNKSNKGESMENTILVVKIRSYSDGDKMFFIEKSAPTVEKAVEYLVALNTLNTEKDITFVMCKEFING
jgi:hypothetical protein|tara:strand:- start:312 stop:521 length:210 start_codon:yes stop_codon:yes gene_type:complete